MRMDRLNAAKMDWAQRLCSDTDLSHIAARVGVLIVAMINRDTQEAFPGQDLLAEKCGVSARYIRQALDELEAKGYLQICRGGVRSPNRYRPIFEPQTGTIVPPDGPECDPSDRNYSSDQDASRAEPLFRSETPDQKAAERNHCSGLEASEDDETAAPENCNAAGGEGFDRNYSSGQTFQTGTIVPVKSGVMEPQTGTIVPPNPIRDLYNQVTPYIPPEPRRPTKRMQLSEAIELTREAFEDWWATYPLKKGKKAGHQAFAKIFLEHRATVDELMAGALAYAGERAGKDPAFTKHAATWLNGDCWKDETLPAKPIGHAGGSSLTDYALAQFGAAE